MISSTITDSPQMQNAVLGYCIAEAEIFDHSQAFGIDAKWFTDEASGVLYKALVDFHEKIKRHPTLSELKSQHMLPDDPRAVQYRLKLCDEVLALREQFGYDVIEPAIRDWAKAALYVEETERIAEMYVRGDKTAAYEQTAKLSERLDRLDTITTGERFKSSRDRVVDALQAVRTADPPIKTGFTFFDDLTNGIRKQDLVVISAPTGIGKTQIASIVSSNAGANGYKVAFFALEAEDNEIEARTLYSTVNTMWTERFEFEAPLDYQCWLGGEYKNDQRIRAIEDEAVELVRDPELGKMANVSTFYRRSGSYNIDDLTLDIVRTGRTHNLIVVDHLQYVDNDPTDRDQWAGVKKIMQKLSDLAYTHRVPIVLLAHIRKGDNKLKGKPLMCNIDDVFGSGDVTKIATKVLLLGRGRGLIWTSGAPKEFERSSLTFARMVKCRTAGERTDVVGVVMYDRVTGTYSKTWCPGYFTKNETIWTPSPSIPIWAKHGQKLLIETEEQT